MHFFILYGIRGLSWALVSAVMQNFLGREMWGFVDVDLMFRRRWSMDVPDALEVERAVCMVLLGVLCICFTSAMGDEVM